MSRVFASVGQVIEQLAEKDYVADRALAAVLFVSHRLEKPIFL